MSAATESVEVKLSVVKNQRLIVVLGMHRSGTSALTKSLELLGVGLGHDLHPAGADNPKGFWEDRKCLKINNSLLEHLGIEYDGLSMAWEDIQADEKVQELRSIAIQYITQKLNENQGIWGFKDPRTCRLFGFWEKVFLELTCEISYVVAIRNPASVAASLVSRNRIPAEKGYYLWLQHVLPAMKFIQNARRVFVDYDEFLQNPYLQIVRISRNLDLPLPDRDDSSVNDFQSNFLEKGLRHTCFTPAELASDKRAATIVAETYGLLLKLATDQLSLESADVQSSLDKLNERLREATPLFDYVNSLENERRRLIDDLKQAVATRDLSQGQVFSTSQIRRLETEHIRPDMMLREMILSLARGGQSKAVSNIYKSLEESANNGLGVIPVDADSGQALGYKIDLYKDGQIMGWALDKNCPLRKLTVEISQSGQVIAKGVANQYRRDLAVAEFGDGCCAFKLNAETVPSLDGGDVVLNIPELGKTFSVHPASIKGIV